MDEQFAGCQVTWHTDGAVLRLTRAEKLNAITTAMLDGLSSCLDALEQRHAKWLVVIGEGQRAFCAGTDLAEVQTMSREQLDAKHRRARDLFVRLANAPVTSIAAINGLACGGGLELAMACTLRIAAPHAAMSLPEVKLGVLPSYGGTQFLPALVGPSRALDLMLTGRSVGVDEALSMGLINRVAKADSPLLDQAIDLAGHIAQYSSAAVGGIRRCVAAAGWVVTAQGLAVECAQVAALQGSEDSNEGILAFLEKRRPVFRN